MPSWTPTQAERDIVRAMAGYGVSAADIARVVAKGVDEATFLAACGSDLEDGQIQAGAKLAEQLYTQAVNGNTAALLHLSRQQMGAALSAYATTAEMCSWLCINKASLHDMRKRGVVEITGKDKWNVKATVQAVMKHYRDVAAGRKASSADVDAPDLVTERALLARAQREAVEMANDVERGKLIPAGDVEKEMAEVAKIVTRALETLPDRLERDLRLAPAVVESVAQQCRAVREELYAAMVGEELDARRSA